MRNAKVIDADGMVEILDVMRLMAHQDIAPMTLRQLQCLAGIEIGLHDHPATREDRRKHHLNGATDVKERLRAKKAIGFAYCNTSQPHAARAA